MALTKLPKNAFGTGSVDDSKIEDGTIQNQELAGSLSEDKLATGTIENASLSNSSITINGTSISLGGSSSVGVEVNWQSVITADGSTTTTGVAGNGYFIDTTSAAHTFNLPTSATLGDQIAIKDYAGTFSSNNLTIGRNGHNIQGVANDSLISTNRASLLLVYVDSTKGWIYAEESNVADLEGPVFITATGGTITESGDFKIHTFTGDGCFVVSAVGSCAPRGDGPGNVDYLVVAGGAGGGNGSNTEGGGGGGAGGYRTTFPSPGCNAGAFPISVTTYPITVGGGGAAIACVNTQSQGNDGSNSVFSTITSTGGGGGGAANGSSPFPGANGRSGGSGGGGATGHPAQTFGGTGGSGNTPPVSPPQGNPGGASPANGPSDFSILNAGGGGASQAGSNSGNFPGGAAGDGGNGSANSITGSPVSYAGGGGGGGNPSYTPQGGSGGSGGGGGGGPPAIGSSGTVNTGGGGGGSGYGCAGYAGGTGIVIIRYKFQ